MKGAAQAALSQIGNPSFGTRDLWNTREVQSGSGESDSRTRVLGSPAVQGYATVAYPPEPYWCIRTVRVQEIRIQDSVFDGISVSLSGKLIRFE